MSRKPPVKYTCPDIDSVIKSITIIKKQMESCDIENITTELDDWSYDLFSLCQELEDLRKSNDALRNWGTDLAAECENLENDVEALNDKISELEDKISELSE